MFHRPAIEREGTKTRRREIRRDVRMHLGTSSDPVPSLDACLRAARELARMIDLASNGRYGLATVRAADPVETTQTAIYSHTQFTGGEAVRVPVLNTSSQVHEPIDQTIQIERELRSAVTNAYLATAGR